MVDAAIEADIYQRDARGDEGEARDAAWFLLPSAFASVRDRDERTERGTEGIPSSFPCRVVASGEGGNVGFAHLHFGSLRE
eukprot:7222986-Prymnesium_polylepis.1